MKESAEDKLALVAAAGIGICCALWGALLTASIILQILMPKSVWGLGIVSCAIIGFVAGLWLFAIIFEWGES